MHFKLIIDPDKEEEIVATVHSRSPLIDELEALILKHTDRIPGYAEDEIKLLTFGEIECVTVLDGKTYAIDSQNRQYRLKQRLYELEQILSTDFIKINQSCIINKKQIARFEATIGGALRIVLKNGYTDYVARRQLKTVKERLGL